MRTLLGMLLAWTMLGPASGALAQSELMGDSLILRAPGFSGSARTDLAPAAPGSIGSLKGTVGQSSPLDRLTGFPSLIMLASGFLPIAAVIDCADPEAPNEGGRVRQPIAC